MAFFENLGGTLAAKGKDVAEKAKEIAEINRLNGQIHTQEHMEEKIYIELGKAVSGHREDLGSMNVSAQLAELDSVQAEIARLREELLRVKGIRRCAGCGAQISEDAAFCPSCGCAAPGEEEASKQEAPAGTECPGCHREVEPDAVLCPFCGIKLQ